MGADSSQYNAVCEAVEGSTVDHWHEADGLACDFCSERIRPNREIKLYLADRVLNPGVTSDGVALLATYGPCCRRRMILFPHRGTTELLLSATVTPELTIEDVDVLDVSPADDGEPWDPIEVWNEVAPLDFAANARQAAAMKGHPIMMGPEDVVNSLLKMGVDVREVVDEDGQIVTDPEMRKKWDEAMDETARKRVKEWQENGTPWE